MTYRLQATRVGVIGSGVVGQTLAAGFASRGHDVMLGSRDPEKDEVRAWLDGAGQGTSAGTFADTAEHGELLVLATLGLGTLSAVALAGPERFAGKVVIDATNPLDFSGGFPPRLAWEDGRSLGESVQATIPDARVVKAFNIIGNPYFVDPQFAEGKPTMLIAGDDDSAKATVGEVVEDFGWPPAVDIGGIEAARELEEVCILWSASAACAAPGITASRSWWVESISPGASRHVLSRAVPPYRSWERPRADSGPALDLSVRDVGFGRGASSQTSEVVGGAKRESPTRGYGDSP